MMTDVENARAVLRNPDASDIAIVTACDVLAASNDWHDIAAVRSARNAMWTPPDMAQDDDNGEPVGWLGTAVIVLAGAALALPVAMLIMAVMG